jgi:hypothetical protein
MKKPLYPPKARRLWLHEIVEIHRGQHGKCAACADQVPVAGKARALDPMTNRILCKACSVVLGIVRRDPARLGCLAIYLQENHGEDQFGNWRDVSGKKINIPEYQFNKEIAGNKGVQDLLARRDQEASAERAYKARKMLKPKARELREALKAYQAEWDRKMKEMAGLRAIKKEMGIPDEASTEFDPFIK